nr:uncharacterized protein LOC131742395 isoform X3 [Kogia breviceps]
MRGWSWPGLGWITAAVNHPPPKSKLRCYLTQVPKGVWTQEGGTSSRLSVCDPLTSRVASSSLMPHLDGGLRKLVPGHWGRGWAETSEGSEFSPPASLVSPTGQHYSDDFAQVNPLRKVPALKDGDFTLAESVAILLYLTRKYEAPDHWYPQDLQARARVDEYLAWQHTALRTSCTRTMWQKAAWGYCLLGEKRINPSLCYTCTFQMERC